MAGDMNATPLLLSNQIRVVANAGMASPKGPGPTKPTDVIACITLPFGLVKVNY